METLNHKYLKYKTKYQEYQNDLNGGKRMKKKKNINNNNKLIKKNKYSIMPDYPDESLSEPWFSLISLGLKTVEGRKNKGKFKEMKIGETIEWVNNDFMPRSILTKITDKVEYLTFEEYLTNEGLDKCLPGMIDIEHGLSVYFKYFTKEDEAEYGVIAIKLELIK